MISTRIPQNLTIEMPPSHRARAVLLQWNSFSLVLWESHEEHGNRLSSIRSEA